ncbi:hypothetical protein WME98_27890 [Sorangium sp. So ce296]|uniref:hypothetical protein n=1 Tax=Sorangium sp. So ce296 TaxID=3133296 RepID=UPI003F624732
MLTPHRQLVVPALLLILAACANGTDELMPGYYEEQAGGGGSGGGGGEGGDGGVDASSSSRSSSSASTSSSSAGAGGAGGEGGSSDGGGGEGGDGGAAGECDYGAPNTCTGAEDLGEISGDVDADSITVTGTTSKWFKVYVVDDFTIPPLTESFMATLTSPPGMNFDLIVYQGDISVPDCFASGVRGQGTPESFMTTWNDRSIDDDHLWFSIEVRHVEGTACGEDAKWTLKVQGNPDG